MLYKTGTHESHSPARPALIPERPGALAELAEADLEAVTGGQLAARVKPWPVDRLSLGPLGTFVRRWFYGE